MTFYIKMRGKVFGPFTEQDTVDMVRKGKVSRANEVSENGIDWFYASESEILFPKYEKPELKEDANEKLYDGGEDQSPEPQMPYAPPFPQPNTMSDQTAFVPQSFMLTKYCTACGNGLVMTASICPKCGTACQDQVTPKTNSETPAEKKAGDSGATASVLLGLLAIFAWIIPLFGFPVTIVGIICGICGTSGKNKGLAIFGLVFNLIFFVVTIINSALGAYLGFTGQLRF